MIYLSKCEEVYILTLPLIIWGRRGTHDCVTMPCVDSLVDWLRQNIRGLVLSADCLDNDLASFYVVSEVIVLGGNVLGPGTPFMDCCHLHGSTVVFKNLASDSWGGFSHLETCRLQFLQQLHDGDYLPGSFRDADVFVFG